jgi:hypothetical protein
MPVQKEWVPNVHQWQEEMAVQDVGVGMPGQMEANVGGGSVAKKRVVRSVRWWAIAAVPHWLGVGVVVVLVSVLSARWNAGAVCAVVVLLCLNAIIFLI